MNIASTPKRIAIFRAGDQVASDGRALSFSAQDLQQIADTYDPAVGKAPLVVGHPRFDDPAFGWATGLSVEGDLLMADVDQVEAKFAAMVNEGRFQNRSASIFLPDTPGNPTPGKLYLKHIGFLGAAVPAVPGLPPVQFSAAADAAPTFSFPAVPQQEPPMEPKQEPSAAPAVKPQPSGGVAADFAAQLASRTTALDQRETELLAREQQITAAASAAVRADAVSFAAGLVKDGKVLPAQQDAVVELMVALPGADAPVQFAQGSTTVSRPARDLMRELLDGMPVRIDYREKSRGATEAAAVAFAAPSGAHVDATRADQYVKVKALQAANPNLSLVQAARMVGA